MKRRLLIPGSVSRFITDETGTTLLELAMAFSFFLLLMFALLDFGRLSYNVVMAEKSMQIAARIAAVRPAACPGVPGANARPELPVSGSENSRFGSACLFVDPADPTQTEVQICDVPADAFPTVAPDDAISCLGDLDNDTVAEIWNRIGALMPRGTRPDHLVFSYEFDPALNFLGGPYTPIVTVGLYDQATADAGIIDPATVPLDPDFGPVTFEFMNAFGGLLQIQFPSNSVSLPGEDLGDGTLGQAPGT